MVGLISIQLSLLIVICINYSFVAVRKHWQKQEGKVYLAPSRKVQSIMVRSLWGQEFKAAGHVADTARK